MNNNQFPRLVTKRTKCQAINRDGTQCSEAAKVEVVVILDGHQKGSLCKFLMTAFLCNECAIARGSNFFRGTYQHLLDEEKFKESQRELEQAMDNIKSHNEKVAKQNEVVKQYEAGKISEDEMARQIRVIWGTEEAYQRGRREMAEWAKKLGIKVR